LNHEGTPEAEDESCEEQLLAHFRWQPHFAKQLVRFGERKGRSQQKNGRLSFTQTDRQLAVGSSGSLNGVLAQLGINHSCQYTNTSILLSSHLSLYLQP
jgi:hypothetical protein